MLAGHPTQRPEKIPKFPYPKPVQLYGGLTLLGAFVLSIKSYWPAASSYSSFHGIGGIFLIGADSLVVGVLTMLVTSRFMPRYFADGITAPVKAASVETKGSPAL